MKNRRDRQDDLVIFVFAFVFRLLVRMLYQSDRGAFFDIVLFCFFFPLPPVEAALIARFSLRRWL